LDRLDTVSIVLYEINQETENSSLFLRFFWQDVDQFYYSFQQRHKVVGEKQLTVLENLGNPLPRVHTILHVFHEQVNVVDEKELVLFVISDELDQEYVGFLQHFEV